jgi:hypothetical protein
VFDGATNYTCLLFLEKSTCAGCDFVKVDDLESWRMDGKAVRGMIPLSSFVDSEWNFAVGEGARLFDRLRRMPHVLGEIADIYVGIQTSADDVFILELLAEGTKTLRLASKALHETVTLEGALLHPLVSGTDVKRYSALPARRQYVLFPYETDGSGAKLIDFDVISRLYPQTASYLLANKHRLSSREEGRMRGPHWYGYIYLKNMNRQAERKICVPRLVDTLYAAYDASGTHFLDNVDVGGVVLKSPYRDLGDMYLLGLLNSSLLRWYFPYVSAPFRGGYLSANRQFLSQLPIRVIDPSDRQDEDRRGKLAAYAARMLETNTRKLSEKLAPSELQRIEREIAATDAQIDNLVYELYDITDKDRKVIERVSDE